MSGSNFYFQFSHRLYMSYRLWYSSVAGFYQEAFGHVTCNLSGCCIVAFIMFMLYYVSFYFLLVQVFLRTSALIHLPFEIWFHYFCTLTLINTCFQFSVCSPVLTTFCFAFLVNFILKETLFPTIPCSSASLCYWQQEDQPGGKA